MQIAFLLGSAHVGGGTFVIFQHALAMKRRGWTVKIITEQQVTEDDVKWHPEIWREIPFVTYDTISQQTFDLCLATWWRTVYSLSRVSAKTYAYFVQSIESRFFPEDDYATRSWADATYLARLPIITIASWIQEHLQREFDRPSLLARNGIRKDIFRPDGEVIADRQGGKLRVLVEGALQVPFKNVERTIELCQQSKADEIWLLTPDKGVTEYPGIDRVFSCVSLEEAAKVYRSCDVLVKLSYVEGMFGPPLEMFHCGGTAIVYDVSGHEEYIQDGMNAVVIKKQDEDGAIRAINRFKDAPSYLHELIKGALSTASRWPNWETASEQFCRAVEQIAILPSETRGELRAKSRVLCRWFDKHSVQQRTFSEVKSARDECQSRLTEIEGILHMILHSKSFAIMQKIRESPVIQVLKSSLRGMRARGSSRS